MLSSSGNVASHIMGALLLLSVIVWIACHNNNMFTTGAVGQVGEEYVDLLSN